MTIQVRVILQLFSCSIVGIILLNCKGPQGDPGPQGDSGMLGATGTVGAIGAAGVKGNPGNPNVVYTDWKGINWTVSNELASYADSPNLTHYNLTTATTANGVFTKEALSTAAIFTYVKYTTYQDSVVNGTTGRYYRIVERITSKSYISDFYFKVPGRTNATFSDYGFAFINVGGVAENYFAPAIELNTFTLGQPIPELKNKSAAFVRGLVSNTPLFRHVIIYGGVKGGRMAAVDWSDYNAVKQALNLTD